ncbi:hypothetical protein ACIQXI_10835 [Lysinibacillus sp. NPDC097195]|uniref:hypothetical protein n=1 Tax=Lysinibacillus sp. NPDC097195 TaxID=3364141 RepID=UPI003820B668
MKKIIFLFLLCLAIVGCSNDNEVDSSKDILSNVAEFNFQQSFDLSKEQSVTMFVEVYENGKFIDDRNIYFANNFKGKGKAQFSMFRQDNSAELFLIGAIQDKENVISKKMFIDTINWGLIFKEKINNVITEKGQYRIGMYGSLSEKDSTSSTEPLKLSVEDKKEFVEAYERYPIIYVVVVEVT